MLFSLFFVFWRFMQILTLIPAMGMLAWFVNRFVDANALSPDWLLIIFITSVLALAWAIFTLFSYHRSKSNAMFVGLIDLCFVGAFIASVYYLRWIRHFDCTNVVQDSSWSGSFLGITITGPGFEWNTDKSCAMLKASWAFAIMNIFFFFFTAVLALMHGDRHDDRHYHKSRHHRHRSGSRHSSRRSSHSHRRTYV